MNAKLLDINKSLTDSVNKQLKDICGKCHHPLEKISKKKKLI